MQTRAGEHDTASAAPVSPSAESEPAASQILLLPVELLEHIVRSACRSSWLPLFRTCKQLRDAVFFNAAAGWTKQLQTKLFLAPAGYFSPHYIYNTQFWHAVSHPYTATYLEADNESHNLLESIAAINSQQKGVSLGPGKLHLDISGPASKPDSSRQLVRQQEAQSWISFLVSDRLALPAVALTLQHVTELRLYNIQLQQPMPEVIYQACPIIRRYELERVEWPQQAAASTKVWSHLQHLQLHSSSVARLASLFNPIILPAVSNLEVSDYPKLLHGAQAVAECCHTFCSQVTQLELFGFANLAVWLLPHTVIAFPVLRELKFLDHIQDQQFATLLAAAPCLERLSVNQLSLMQSHRNTTCGLKLFHSQHGLFNTDTLHIPSNYVVALGRLPHMPNLQSMCLPKLDVARVTATAQQVAATVQALSYLPMLEGCVQLCFDTDVCQNIEAGDMGTYISCMKTLSPLLQLLCMKVKVLLNGAQTQNFLHVLSAACMSHMVFDVCLEPSARQQLWAMMPHLNHVTIQPRPSGPDILEVILALCRAADRPVTVQAKLTTEQYQQISDLLKAEGRLFAVNAIGLRVCLVTSLASLCCT